MRFASEAKGSRHRRIKAENEGKVRMNNRVAIL